MDSFNSNSPVELTEGAIAHISGIRKWTKFLSILGFVFIGLMVVLIPVMIASTSTMGLYGVGAFSAIPFIIIIALYVYPIYTLYMFSKHSKLAVEGRDANQYEIAFRFLKQHYQFMGILAIIVLSIYAVMLLFGLLFATFV